MAASPQTIQQLNDTECKEMIDILVELDVNIWKKVNYAIANYGLNIRESLEYIVTNNPILWAKVYLDWEARDYQKDILIEGKHSKKLVLRLGRRLGKCVTGSTKIPDSVTGEYISIKELYDNQKANLFSLDEDKGKIVNHETNIILDNGIKPVFRLTTKSGREIEATGNHPFYTMDGYVDLDNLKSGDFIGVAKNAIHSSPKHMDEGHIKFLAYMIGDGCVTNSSSLRFSCHPSVSKVLNEMHKIASDNDCKMFQYDSDSKYDWNIRGIKRSYRGENNNALLTLLREHGLIGKGSSEKTVPSSIFKLSNEQLKIFLSRLYATDGWATSSFTSKGRVEIGYASSSKELCVDIQSLLLRFGINSILQKKNVKYKGKVNVSYTLGIYGTYDCKKFIEEIGIFSKDEAVNNVEETIKTMTDYGRAFPIKIMDIIEDNMGDITKQQLRNHSGVRLDRQYKTLTESKIVKANELLQSQDIQDALDSDIIWDEIKSIEYIGDEQTYDFTVPKYHNFVANDFITHNTESMCILILWFAYTQFNRGDNEQYDIIVVTPYEKQIDLIFKRLLQLIEASPILQSIITRNVNHHIGITPNGIQSNIIGFTAGASNASGGGNSTRGQRADVLIMDEVDYIGTNQITNILNIRNEAPDRIRLIAASTPSGKHEEYYKWCTNASRYYFPTKEDIKNNEFNGYDKGTRPVGEGNGWTEIYSPSNVNSELLKINPDTKQTYLEDIRDELSDMRYTQEVMAEFGEEERGVYQNQFIQAAINEGYRIKHKYITKWNKEDRKAYLKRTYGQNIRILAVDWDKYSAATNLVCVEFNRLHQDIDGRIVPLFKVLFRIEIPRTEFTYVNAMNKIIELNEEYEFNWIGVDRGYGKNTVVFFINVCYLINEVMTYERCKVA